MVSRPTLTPQLPLDPDLATARAAERPTHLRWLYLTVVAVGGAVGTGIRDLISIALPAAHGVSWAIFWINIIGAFLLGGLLELLARSGPDTRHRRLLRLLLGTGVLGGFTTYSTLAATTAALFLHGRGLAGTGYALLTLLVGALATAAGLTLASIQRSHPRGRR